jgi:hypothetical protein
MSELVPRQLMQQFVEDHGKDPSKWPQELQDLMNPNIQARQLSAPISGQIEKFLNTEFAYTWAKDVCGATPDHSRVEELRYDGWDYATTDDVVMCTEDTVKGRNKERKSADGKGFSNEIRSGDRRLMKVPIMRRREQRKAQNLKAMQMAYPQPFGGDGRPMTLEQFTPGMNTKFATEAEISAIKQNSAHQ